MAITLAVCLALTTAIVAYGDDETTPAAKVGSTTYATLDEAITAAQDGDVVEMLRDCTSNGIDLTKDLTIQAAEGITKPTVTFSKGIALRGKGLKFKDCNVAMTGVDKTAYGEYSWMTIFGSKNSSLSLENAKMVLDGTGVGSDVHAMYVCNNTKINLTDSELIIKNYYQDALEWDGGDGGYNFNLVNSTFTSESNRSAFTGTFYAVFDNSNVNVLNSRGNGSNGTYYTIKNNSHVRFEGNGNWGISAWRIDMTDGSTLVAKNNGYSGVWTRVLNLDGTCALEVTGNGNKAPSAATNAGIFFQGNGKITSTIEEGADVKIMDNAGSGIYTKQGVCNLTMMSGTITGNGAGLNNTKGNIGATYGGGIYNIGTMILDSDVLVYNNHADTAGDDIYNAEDATIMFGYVGDELALDGTPDHCDHEITGWFDDSENARWNAHQMDSLHMVEYDPIDDAVTGLLALKAAHGTCTVIYNDGVEDEELFEDQTYPELIYGVETPDFVGTPTREGYEFKGWDPVVEETVTGDAYYEAIWEKVAPPVDPDEDDDDDTIEPDDPKKPIPDDEHLINPDDPKKPLPDDKNLVDDDTPKTGDSTPITAMLVIFILSVLGLGALAIRKKNN